MCVQVVKVTRVLRGKGAKSLATKRQKLEVPETSARKTRATAGSSEMVKFPIRLVAIAISVTVAVCFSLVRLPRMDFYLYIWWAQLAPFKDRGQ